jgi:16S rRNA (adenine1518-N6/adenine1519-N6)-dimethyltransferase
MGHCLLPITDADEFHRVAAVSQIPDVRGLLRRHNLDPHKGLGQNFLVDEGVLRKIVQVAGVTPMDQVLEIGAGLGSLTTILAQNAARVIAVEIDKKLVPVLSEVMAPYANVEVVAGDMLKLDAGELMGQTDYLVVANIPYYITSALIRHLLESQIKPKRMVLTMQKEVAGRICASAGDYSLLALSVQVFGSVHVVLNIPAGAFFPQPTVDSSTLRIDLYPEPLIPVPKLDTFFMLAHHGFSQKRKTLRNTLAAGLHWNGDQAAALLQAAGIDPSRRAQTLELAEWRTLVGEYSDQFSE